MTMTFGLPVDVVEKVRSEASPAEARSGLLKCSAGVPPAGVNCSMAGGSPALQKIALECGFGVVLVSVFGSSRANRGAVGRFRKRRVGKLACQGV